MTQAADVLTRLMEEFKAIAKMETVVGQPIKVDPFTIIPVTRVSVGLGAGDGAGKDKKSGGEGGGGGGGGGVMVTPIAFIVVKGEEISFHGIRKGGSFGGLVEAMPEILEKMMAARKDKKEPAGEEAAQPGGEDE